MPRIQRPGSSTTTTTDPERKNRKGSNNKPKSKKKSGSGSGGGGFQRPPNVDTPTSTHGYDPNSSYGRGTSDKTYEEWLQNQGINPSQLNKNQRRRYKDRYEAANRGDYALTEQGEMWSNNQPGEYFDYLMGEAGGMMGDMPVYNGQTRFGQWLSTDYKQQTQDNYGAALTANPDLSYQDYMNSIGWGANANKNALITPPGDTGNPFTSTSLPSTNGQQAAQPAAPEVPSWQDFLSDKGIHKFGKLNKGRKERIRDAYSGLSQPTTAPNPLTGTPGVANNDSTGGLASAQRQYRAMTPQQRGTNAATAFKPGRWSIF